MFKKRYGKNILFLFWEKTSVVLSWIVCLLSLFILAIGNKKWIWDYKYYGRSFLSCYFRYGCNLPFSSLQIGKVGTAMTVGHSDKLVKRPTLIDRCLEAKPDIGVQLCGEKLFSGIGLHGFNWLEWCIRKKNGTYIFGTFPTSHCLFWNNYMGSLSENYLAKCI